MKKWIYLIKEESEEGELAYKIGITKRDVTSRLKEHQTGNSNHLEIIGMFESNYSGLLESTLHRVYLTNAKRGEWFKLDNEQVANFLVNCVKIEENLDIVEKNKI